MLIVALDCLSTWSVSISLSVLFLCRSGCLWLWTVCLLGLSPSACLFVSLSVWLSVALDCVSLVYLCLSLCGCFHQSGSAVVCGCGLSVYMVCLHQSVCLVSLSVWLSVAVDCLSLMVCLHLPVCLLVFSTSASCVCLCLLIPICLCLSACLCQAVFTVFFQCLTPSVNLLVICRSCSLSFFFNINSYCFSFTGQFVAVFVSTKTVKSVLL